LSLPNEFGTPDGKAPRPDIFSALIFISQGLGNPVPVGRN
jgi:hypothetical protein